MNTFFTIIDIAGIIGLLIYIFIKAFRKHDG